MHWYHRRKTTVVQEGNVNPLPKMLIHPSLPHRQLLAPTWDRHWLHEDWHKEGGPLKTVICWSCVLLPSSWMQSVTIWAETDACWSKLDATGNHRAGALTIHSRRCYLLFVHVRSSCSYWTVVNSLHVVLSHPLTISIPICWMDCGTLMMNHRNEGSIQL